VPAVQTIAVIGAGIMGRGIAHAAALGGYRTILEDLLPNALRKAETEIRSNLDKAVELKKVTAADADSAFKRLEFAGSVEEAARQADLVIEAVPEEMESKIEIFTLLDKICRPTTILASNTSSLSVTEIASVTYRAKRCIGMHFFNPVHKMKLLEVVRALETDEDTLNTAVEVGRRMGKEVVVIKESPGFITSRINAMIGNEAFYMLQEGIASPAAGSVRQGRAPGAQIRTRRLRISGNSDYTLNHSPAAEFWARHRLYFCDACCCQSFPIARQTSLTELPRSTESPDAITFPCLSETAQRLPLPPPCCSSRK
jgi:3-hydroxybutyryl-CoA dehydrogenase